jgi:hypothetical protein
VYGIGRTIDSQFSYGTEASRRVKKNDGERDRDKNVESNLQKNNLGHGSTQVNPPSTQVSTNGSQLECSSKTLQSSCSILSAAFRSRHCSGRLSPGSSSTVRLSSGYCGKSSKIDTRSGLESSGPRCVEICEGR